MRKCTRIHYLQLRMCWEGFSALKSKKDLRIKKYVPFETDHHPRQLSPNFFLYIKVNRQWFRTKVWRYKEHRTKPAFDKSKIIDANSSLVRHSMWWCIFSGPRPYSDQSILSAMGPSINYVFSKSAIFDHPSPTFSTFYYVKSAIFYSPPPLDDIVYGRPLCV